MDVSLRLFSITFEHRVDRWWRTTDRLQRFFETMQATPFGDRLAVFRKGDEPELREGSDSTQVAKALGRAGQGMFAFYDRAEDPSVSMSVAVRPNALNVALRVLAVERLHPQTAIPDLTSTAQAIHGAFLDESRIGPDFAVTPLDFAYPMPRPRRLHPLWGVGNVVDFYSRKDREARGHADQLERLATRELPPEAHRSTDGDLIIIQWIRDLGDLRAVALAVGAAEGWLGETLDLPMAPDFNTSGHQRLMPAGLESRPPLTFFDPVQNEGYKAVVPGPDGRLDGAEVEEYATWVRQAALPDGTNLAKLHLIAPSAAAAEALSQDAGEVGAARVFYVDDDGALWDPSPPGWWQE